MNDFLNKEDIQAIKIVTYLMNNQAKWIKSSYLTTLLSCSNKKLVTAIKEINNTLLMVYPNEHYEISMGKGRGFRLDESPHTWIELEMYYFESSVSFNFIKKILLEPSISTTEFCMNHYISISTLTRRMRACSSLLAGYGLLVNLGKGKLDGNEIQIRHFYFDLFSRVYGNKVWPFRNLHREYFRNDVQKVSRRIGVAISNMEEYMAMLYTAIFCYTYLPETLYR